MEFKMIKLTSINVSVSGVKMKLLITILLLSGCSRSEFNHEAETQSASQDSTVDTKKASSVGTSQASTNEEKVSPPMGTTQSKTNEEGYEVPPPFTADGYEYYRFKLGMIYEEIFPDNPQKMKVVNKPQDAYFDIRIQGNVADRTCNLVGKQKGCIIEKEMEACFIDKVRSVTHNFANDDTKIIYWPYPTVTKEARSYRNRQFVLNYHGVPPQPKWQFSVDWSNRYRFYSARVHALVPDLKEGGDNFVAYDYYHMHDRSFNKQVPYTPEDSCFSQ